MAASTQPPSIEAIMKNILLSLLAGLLGLTTLTAQQFDLSAEIRPRYENNYGYQSLRITGAEAAHFISQRSRLNFDLKQDNLKLKIVLQNVRVWGDMSTLARDDNATSLQEAWAELLLTKKTSLKMGRQEIVYDDHRIFGNVEWAQQARSHDALLLKFNPHTNHRLDVGFAYNADNQSRVDTSLYSNIAGYKTLQYVWYHGNFNKFQLSMLALNTGVENEKVPNGERSVAYMQTFGPRLTYKAERLSGDLAAYIQSGSAPAADIGVNAYYVGGNLNYKIGNFFSIGAGAELLSGKDMNDPDSDIKSFAPLFGTNHKFNGWMDYFYVGNHANSVGLNDFYGHLAYKKDKLHLKVIPHFFSARGAVIQGTTEMDARLGTEIDFLFEYDLYKDVDISGGYSQMFATETMEVLKGGNSDITNSWIWLMVTIKPKLFSAKK